VYHWHVLALFGIVAVFAHEQQACGVTRALATLAATLFRVKAGLASGGHSPFHKRHLLAALAARTSEQRRSTMVTAPIYSSIPNPNQHGL
jgi:hypothetical protein